METLSIRSIRKTFPTPTGPLTVLDDVNLTIAPGELFFLLGPSG